MYILLILRGKENGNGILGIIDTNITNKIKNNI